MPSWETPPPPLSIVSLKDCPPSMTQALLLMKGDSDHVKSAWRVACRFIASIPTEKNPPDRLEASEPIIPSTNKGHAICVEHTGCYSYCAGCRIARCVRDMKFICVKECTRTRDPPPYVRETTSFRALIASECTCMCGRALACDHASNV